MKSSLRNLTVAATCAFVPLVMSAQQEKMPPAPRAAVALNLSSPEPDSNQITTPNSEQSGKQSAPLVNPDTPTVSMTRADAERLALKNNPRITASQLLALAAGQVTRETRSAAPSATHWLSDRGRGRKRESHRCRCRTHLFTALLPLRRGWYSLATHYGLRPYALSRSHQQAPAAGTKPNDPCHTARCSFGYGSGLLPSAGCPVALGCRQGYGQRPGRCSEPDFGSNQVRAQKHSRPQHSLG